MSSKTEWLAGLKVGDLVIVHISHFAGVGCLTAVRRLTATQIVIGDGARFRRRDGDEVGPGGYYRRYLEEPTPERRAVIKHQQIVARLKQVRWKDLSLATLEAVTERCAAVITIDLERAKVDGRTVIAGVLQDCRDQILRPSLGKGM